MNLSAAANPLLADFVGRVKPTVIENCPLQGRVPFCEDAGNGGQGRTDLFTCKVQRPVVALRRRAPQRPELFSGSTRFAQRKPDA